MIALAPLIVTFMLVSVVFTTIAMNNTSDSQQKVNTVKQINLDNIAMSGLDIAKEAISNGNYKTDETMYIDEKITNFNVLNSTSLESKMKNYELGKDKGIINIGYKENGNYVSVIIQAKKNNKSILLGFNFLFGNNFNLLPLAYAGKTSFSNVSMCSYEYDEINKKIGSLANPNFNFYINDSFTTPPNFLTNENATNESNINIHLENNNYFNVSGYDGVKNFYATGDVSVNNSSIENFYSAGTINSSIGTIVNEFENVDYTYASVNQTFENNNFNYTAETKKTLACGNDSCKNQTNCVEINSSKNIITAGDYNKLIITNSCKIDELILSGSKYSFVSIDIENNLDLKFSAPDVELNANEITIKDNNEFKYIGTEKNSYMIIASNEMTMNNNSKITCVDPRQCLIDTNDFKADNSIIQGSLLGRNSIDLKTVEVYGNIIGENLEADTGTKICNLLDENGVQLMSDDYFNLTANETMKENKINEIISQVLCKNYNDCVSKLNGE